MKKKRSLALAMASVALTGMIVGCEEHPRNNAPDTVYGPPANWREELHPPVYGPPTVSLPSKSEENFRPEENEPAEVYGPPIADEEPIEEDAGVQEQSDNVLPE